MNNADIVGIGIIVVFTALGAILGFTRGMGGFLGVFFGCKMAEMQFAAGAPANKYLMYFAGISLAGYLVGFLFYNASKFTPIESMDGVFGAILGFCAGWGIAFGIFHYYAHYLPDSSFYALIYEGRYARGIYDVAPYTEFMRRMDPLRNPDPFGDNKLTPGETPAQPGK
jgi:hypothetical protein